MLKNRIQILIDLIKNTEIEEIEVSSFWGAQKIRLSKNKPNQTLEKPITKELDESVYNINDKNNSDLEFKKDSKIKIKKIKYNNNLIFFCLTKRDDISNSMIKHFSGIQKINNGS